MPPQEALGVYYREGIDFFTIQLHGFTIWLTSLAVRTEDLGCGPSKKKKTDKNPYSGSLYGSLYLSSALSGVLSCVH